MKLSVFAIYWGKSWPIALLLCATGLLISLFFFDFDAALGSTDMIGEATLNNIRVSARVSFYFKALGFFFLTVFFSVGLVRLVLNLPAGEIVINRANYYAKIALIFCLQQVVFNSISFFFVLFFLITFCFFLISHIFFPVKQLPFKQTIILTAGVTFSFFISNISGWLIMLFLAEILLNRICISYIDTESKIFKKYFNQYQCMYLLSAFSLGSILSYLLLKPKIDLSDTLIRLYKDKLFPNIPWEAFLLPVFCTIGLYLFFRRLHNQNLLIKTGWLCFLSVFVALQFTNHYLPSLLILLSFFALGGMKNSRSNRVVEFYSLVNDLLLSIAFFYLLNQFFSSLLDKSWDYLLPVFFITLVYLRRRFMNFNKAVQYYKYSLGVIFLPFCLLVSQETVMVFNQRFIFIGRSGYVSIFILLLLLVIIFLTLWKPKKISAVLSVSFSLAVAGMAFYNAYHPVFNGAIDFFEDASAALAIKRTNLYREVPLFQHFSPHNLNDYLTGLLYAWINNDVSLGYKTYAFVYALFFLVYYYFLIHLLRSRFYAILLVIFSVTLQVLFPFYHAIVILFFLIISDYFQKNYSKLKLFCLAGLLLIMLLFRPDTGFALFLASSFGIPFIARFFDNGWFKLKRLFVAAIIVLLLFFLLTVSLLDFREIWENVQLTLGYLQSAQSWGYTSLSNILNYKFRFHYFVFPLTVTFIFIYAILQSNSGQKNRVFHWTALIFFCTYYMANFQRGLVRHSFVENTDEPLSSFVFLIFSLFISLIIVKQSSVLKFTFVFLVSSASLIWVFKFPRPQLLRSMYSASVDKIRTENFPVFNAEKANRFIYMSRDQLIASEHSVFVYSIVDQLRNYYRSRDLIKTSSASMSFQTKADSQNRYEGLVELKRSGIIQGYIDEVCYQPLSAFFLNERPIHFFNQGVHFYHNNRLQSKFVNEMLAGNCNYVLVSNVSALPESNSLDKVPHSVRHYYVFQHIYDNYRPSLIVDGMTLWTKDSIGVNTNPLFRQSYNSDSVYQINMQFPKHRRALLTVYGIDSIPNDIVFFNNSSPVSVSFYNKEEKKAYVIIDSAFQSIKTLKTGIIADSISLEGYDYFPDLFTRVPQTYHLKMLPYVLGHKNQTVGKAIDFKSEAQNTSVIDLGEELETKGAAFRFVLSNNSHEIQNVKVQYYKENSMLGEYTFSLKPGKDIPYLLLVASQPNWNLAKPDAVKLILPGKSYLSTVSIIHKDELSY